MFQSEKMKSELCQSKQKNKKITAYSMQKKSDDKTGTNGQK